jgi:hypothetical protein
MDGDAIQKDITGASGTPLMSNDAITGMTPHEQKGLKAPTIVASKTAVIGLVSKARLIYLKECLENFADHGPKPVNILFIELVAGSGAFDNSGDPAGLFEHLKMLRNGSLGNGEIFDNIARDATRMRHQKLDDFKPDGITDRFEHTN